MLSVISVQSVAGTLGSVVAGSAGRSGGVAVMVVTAFVGYVIVLFVGLGLFDVPVQHLLLGGALTGVVLGIAAQQARGARAGPPPVESPRPTPAVEAP